MRNVKDSKDRCLIVGIGASAGGLNSFQSFFSAIPKGVDSGMAFVLVPHLEPKHKNIFPELIRRYTSLPVFVITEGMTPQSNCVYISPYHSQILFSKGKFRLADASKVRGPRFPIDHFFSSLAISERERAMGVVLSGSGCDGTNGLMEIKEAGGVAIAQKPEGVDYDLKPLNAIRTGMVDEVLAPDKIFDRLIYFKDQPNRNQSPFTIADSTQFEIVRKKVFALIKKATGHDFSLYKANAIERRIERRMFSHQIVNSEDYLKILERQSSEVRLLFNDLLIGVTHFFRDSKAFDTLQAEVISVLEKKRSYGGEIRIWSMACSTGEEVYSLAMLIHEARRFGSGSFKIFATDIDPRAIEKARRGVFPLSIADQMTPQRLKAFFKLEPDGKNYRIQKTIRDQIVFSVQDVIKDPPFSKLDLILCRNLLIYFNTDFQKKLIPLFHSILNPGGFLFLGSSEGIGDHAELFTVVDRTSKIFQRKELSRTRVFNRSKKFTFLEAENSDSIPDTKIYNTILQELSLREFTEQRLLQKLEVVGVMINKKGEILHHFGEAELYLDLSPREENVQNIHQRVREGLGSPLFKALQQSISTEKVAHCSDLRVTINGDSILVDLSVSPAKTRWEQQREESFYLVTFEKSKNSIPVLDQKKRKKLRTLARKEDLSLQSCIKELEMELNERNEYFDKNQLVSKMI